MRHNLRKSPTETALAEDLERGDKIIHDNMTKTVRSKPHACQTDDRTVLQLDDGRERELYSFLPKRLFIQIQD